MMVLEKVRVVKARRHILDGVSLATRPGEVAVALGVNGAGKSSLVRLMSGEWRPDAGRVIWEGRPLHQRHPQEVARWRAVVNQQVDLRFDFTVREVVEMGRFPHATPRGVNATLVEAAIEEMDLTRLRERRVTRLSGGERRRVWMARALAQLAEARTRGGGLLILDEPTAHLDLRHQELLLRRMRMLAGEGVSVFAVLHDINHAARVADRVVLVERGKVVADGPPERVMTHERLSRLYGVSLRRTGEFGGGRVPAGTVSAATFQPEPITL